VRALVRADLAGPVLLDAHAREEALARALRAVGRDVVLDERVDSGLLVARERAVLLPLLDQLRRVRVGIAAVGILGQVDADDVVGRALLQRLALLGIDDVVGRGDDRIETTGHVEVVAEGQQRVDVRHGGARR
jgi:hypothetical protein